ncbi:hypothetical protein [Solihabitans fulvus]|uniref:hypothetical protein n=1 Tax=Solihabitans fulvus TaxID=1892852 RepID=UPI001CB763E6|nr:hypothetical protein [Solihabitans fulvus]
MVVPVDVLGDGDLEIADAAPGPLPQISSALKIELKASSRALLEQFALNLFVAPAVVSVAIRSIRPVIALSTGGWATWCG